MKRFEKWVRSAVGRPGLWNALNGSVVRVAEYVSIQRAAALDTTTQEFAAKIFPDKKVRHGPFQGMEYPDLEAVGSFLYPKLLGCYERELHPVVEEFCRQPLPLVIDVGCAEGYYAVGFALRCKGAKVIAFDIDPKARELCERMARKNGVAERVELRSVCDAACLASLTSGASGLVISDCEGTERFLFSAETVPALRNFHLLIETHDRACPGTSEHLCELFAATHFMEAVLSVDDEFKVDTYNYPELDGAERWLKKRLVQECRGVQMKWLCLRSRTLAGSP